MNVNIISWILRFCIDLCFYNFSLIWFMIDALIYSFVLAEAYYDIFQVLLLCSVVLKSAFISSSLVFSLPRFPQFTSNKHCWLSIQQQLSLADETCRFDLRPRVCNELRTEQTSLDGNWGQRFQAWERKTSNFNSVGLSRNFHLF